MYSLEEIVNCINNLRNCRVDTYKKIVKGFLIEINDTQVLFWNFSESITMYRRQHAIILKKMNEIAEVKNQYIYVNKDEHEVFIKLLGNPAIELIKWWESKEKKVSKDFIMNKKRIERRYAFVYPFKLIEIFIKVLKCKTSAKAECFNYYQATKLEDYVYNEIIKNHYPVGFNMPERKNILNKIIKNRLINLNGPWLDLGCGLHSLLQENKDYCNGYIYMVDPNQYVEKNYENHLNKEKIKFISGCGEKLPFEDNFFEFIYCGGVIGHVCYLDKFLKECKRVLKPGGKILFDESNEYPRSQFARIDYTKKLNEKIKGYKKITKNYTCSPPADFVCNPWAYWGCSTDHFWIMNMNGMKAKISSNFKILKMGSLGSYLRNNGVCEKWPLFYPLDLGEKIDKFIDFKNLPQWFLALIKFLVKDDGIYIFSFARKET